MSSQWRAHFSPKRSLARSRSIVASTPSRSKAAISSGEKSDQVEVQPAAKGPRRGGRRRRQLLFCQARPDEGVDRRGDTRDRGNGSLLRGNECPVAFVVRSLFDPSPQGVALRVGQRLLLRGRGHHGVGIVAGDPAVQLALFGLSGNDCWRAGGASLQGSLSTVEPQVRLAGLVVHGVAARAVLREDRLHLTSIVDGGLGRAADAE